ncbi:hypothetical protein D3C75_1337560 [compost metagenome]
MAAFTLFVRASVADNSLNFDQCRFAAVRLRFGKCFTQCRKIVAVFYAQHLPAIGFKAFSNIFGERKIQLAV